MNGKGKEYDFGRLIFEGEYLNEKRNGSGKEYYFDKGEYLNGQRNGKGKEYNKFAEVMFEEKYLNGKRWNGTGYNKGIKIYEINNGNGTIKEYKENNSLIFEGERNGIGKKYNNAGNLIFEGEYLKGNQFKGKLFEFYKEYGPLKFEGEYINGGKMATENNIKTIRLKLKLWF